MDKRFVSWCLLVLAIWFVPLVVQAAPLVEKVRVELDFPQGRPSPVLLERMNASLSVISEHLLKERSTEAVAERQADYRRLIGEVAERVLTGYSVEQVVLTVGPETLVKLAVRPWGPVVERADVQLTLSGVSTDMLPMVRMDLGPLEAEVQALFLGLSQDAVDWSSGAVKAEIRRRVEARVPEFQTTVDISAEPVPKVNIVLLPIGQTVQRVQYQLFSLSIPNVLMLEEKEQIGRLAQAIRGLPVRYAARHATELTQWLATTTANTSVAKRYRLTPEVAVKADVDTQVQIRLESDRYRFWAEGYVDVDRRDDNITGRLHAGKFFSPQDEAFVELTLHPTAMDWTVEPGYARHNGPWMFGAQVELGDQETHWWAERSFANNWRVRAQVHPQDDDHDITLRYRLHEFLSVEFVAGRHEQFLRVVGNL